MYYVIEAEWQCQGDEVRDVVMREFLPPPGARPFFANIRILFECGSNVCNQQRS